MRLTLLLGGAPRDHRRVRAAERAALAEAEALARLWDEAPPDLDAIDEAAARLRARLFDLDRARADAEWAACMKWRRTTCSRQTLTPAAGS